MSVLKIRNSLLLLPVLSILACGQPSTPEDKAVENDGSRTQAEQPFQAVLEGSWRRPADIDRDQYRHPAETLEFLGMEPWMTVVEIWPGGGWYTDIIAPYLANGGGHYVAAGFDPQSGSEYVQKRIAEFEDRYVSHPETYGKITVSALSADTQSLAPPASADMVLTFRNIHNWMNGAYAEKVFAEMYEVLRPGGVLGVVEHRATNATPQDPKAASGYVRQDYVIAMAEKAGFVLEASSEINANGADTKDHPFGVWTLPPTLRKSAYEGEVSADYDPAPYLAIGESDRMTLRFRKPKNPDAALME